jgi:DNA polymerase I-like protein with 3'-5' exonuclease and polymerase domains
VSVLPEHITDPNPDIYRSDNYVVLDFETTNLSKGSALDPANRIVLTCWRRGEEHPRGESDMLVSWEGEYGLHELVRDCQEADFIIAHNAKFELQWLERCGLDLAQTVVWCTQLGDYVIGGNRWQYQVLGLNHCVKRRWPSLAKDNIVTRLIKDGTCPSEIPESWLLRYCRTDVELCEMLFHSQRETIEEQEQLGIMYTRCLATPVFADIEKNGMQLDPEHVLPKAEEMERELARLEQDLDDMASGINWSSPQQVAVYLYEDLGFEELTKHGKPMRGKPNKRFPEGQPKTDADTIIALRAKNKKQKAFLAKYHEYRAAYSHCTKYLRKLADCCRDAGGLLYAQFNQTSTRSHRTSSSGLPPYNAQFQNFPRVYKIFFKARLPGWLVGEGDGAQLEFRVAGAVGGPDPVALADIESGKDVHLQSASVLNEIDESEVTKAQRQVAKADTFKPLYGGQSGTEAQMRYYAFFRDRYKGISATQQAWIEEVLDTKQLVLPWGMRFYWPSTKMDRSGYISNTPSICNYPVQSLATADIIPIALVYAWHRIRAQGLRMFLVNTVHDSIIAELPEDEVEDFHELMQQCLIRDVYPYLDRVYGMKFGVPLGAGVTVGTHWSQGEEDKYGAEKELYA